MKRYFLIFAAVGINIGPHLASTAYAQENLRSAASTASPLGHGIEEVVVTARRKEENLQTVPVAVTALNGDVLRQETIVRFEDIQRVVPGFFALQSSRGSSASSFALRGQRGAPTQTILLDPAVSVYFAEYNLSRSTGTNQSLFDLSSIQVLKGPQGTLFGRNSTGGAVLITPQAPTDELEGYAQASAGNYDLRDIELMVNVPVGDKVALRAAAKLSRRDGYLKNVLTGGRANDVDADAFRVSATIKPSDGIVSTFVGSYFRGGGHGSDLVLYVIEPRAVPTTLGNARDLVTTSLQAELAARQGLGKFEYRNRNRHENRERAHLIQNTTTIELGEDLSFKNIIGYRSVKLGYRNNFVGGGIDLQRYIFGRSQSESFSVEPQINGKIGDLAFTVGAYYFRETGQESQLTEANGFLVTPEALGRVTPAVAASFLTRFPGFNLNDVTAKNISYATYFHIDYNLSALLEGLSVSGGGRYTRDKRAVSWRNFSWSTPTPPAFRCNATGVNFPRVDVNACSVSDGLKKSRPTYDVSLNYQASPDLFLYLAHRSGYRSGGFITQPPTLPLTEGRSFGPEKVKDVEFGVKTDYRIGGVPTRFNAAVYRQYYADVQRTIALFNPLTGVASTRIVNAAKAHIDGAEVELVLRPTEALTLSASYAYVAPKYKSWFDFRVIGGVVTPIDISDSRFADVSKHSYSVSAAYIVPMHEARGELTLRASLSGQSGFAVAENSTANCGPDGSYTNCFNRLADLPGFATLNLRADWRNMLSSGTDVSFFINNVTDNFYFSSGNSSLGTLGYAAGSVGAPRLMGVELRVPFGALAY